MFIHMRLLAIGFVGVRAFFYFQTKFIPLNNIQHDMVYRRIDQ